MTIFSVFVLFSFLFDLNPQNAVHTVVYRDPNRYCAFPVIQSKGDSVILELSWNRSGRHDEVAGENSGALLLQSIDEGRVWNNYHSQSGNNGAGELTSQDTSRHFIWPFREEVTTSIESHNLRRKGIEVLQSNGNLIASYRINYISVTRNDIVKKESIVFPNIAFLSGYGRGCTTQSGVMLKPVYGLKIGDKIPSAMVLRSADQGKHWLLLTVANDQKTHYSEMEITQAPNGNLIGLIRSDSDINNPADGFLMIVYSTDDGATWSKPVKTAMWGFPADIMCLKDGTLLCTYGYRRPPFGIRACFSKDNGKTWDVQNEIILRDDLIPPTAVYGTYRTMDFGYPRSFERRDGSIVTVYYCTDTSGVTGIEQTVWSSAYKGNKKYARGNNAVPDTGCTQIPGNISGDNYPISMKSSMLQSFLSCDTTITAISIYFCKKNEEINRRKYGVEVWLRKLDGHTWHTKILARSLPLLPDKIISGGWNIFEFQQPVPVEPNEMYVINIVNRDYYQGEHPKLREDVEIESEYFIATGSENGRDYTNGRMSPIEPIDIGFQIITPTVQQKSK